LVDVTVVIIAGGLGTRSQNPSIPKSLQEINDVPLLDLQLAQIHESGIRNVLLVLNYGAKEIVNRVEKLRQSGPLSELSVKYLRENERRGTLGAFRLAASAIGDKPMIIVLGDILFSFNLLSVYRRFLQSNAKLGLVVHPNSHPFDSDLAITSWPAKRIDSISFKSQHQNDSLPINNLAIAGVYFFDGASVVAIPDVSGDFVRDFVALEIAQNPGSVIALNTVHLCMDVGTHDRLERAEKLVRILENRGRWQSKLRVLFCDLDDTLIPNVEVKDISRKVEVNPQVCLVLRELNELLVPIIVISNQPGIAKGLFSWQQLQSFVATLETSFGVRDCHIDAWYFCPHHPESGWVGEVRELKLDCTCRKPKTGLVFKATEDLEIDYINSVMIGNSYSDAKLAETLGMRFIDTGTDYDQQRLIEALKLAKRVLT